MGGRRGPASALKQGISPMSPGVAVRSDVDAGRIGQRQHGQPTRPLLCPGSRRRRVPSSANGKRDSDHAVPTYRSGQLCAPPGGPTLSSWPLTPPIQEMRFRTSPGSDRSENRALRSWPWSCTVTA